MKDKVITAAHGLGGDKTRELIEQVILPAASNPYSEPMDDSAVLPEIKGEIVFTADSFVVYPAFFPGGDIGSLSVSGTVNDIIAQGGIPLYLSEALILEEGLPLESLRKISESAGKAAREAGVFITCGDVKVVEKSKADGIYISASGIGRRAIRLSPDSIRDSDQIILTGPAGSHGAAIFQARTGLLEDASQVASDAAPLSALTRIFSGSEGAIRFMRDPTRGGIAECAVEISALTGREVILYEKTIPVEDWVRALSYMAGLDWLYLACEGCMMMVVRKNSSAGIIKKLRQAGFASAALCGEISPGRGRAVLETSVGGRRILTSSEIAQVARIC